MIYIWSILHSSINRWELSKHSVLSFPYIMWLLYRAFLIVENEYDVIVLGTFRLGGIPCVSIIWNRKITGILTRHAMNHSSAISMFLSLDRDSTRSSRSLGSIADSPEPKLLYLDQSFIKNILWNLCLWEKS